MVDLTNDLWTAEEVISFYKKSKLSPADDISQYEEFIPIAEVDGIIPSMIEAYGLQACTKDIMARLSDLEEYGTETPYQL